MTQHSAPGRFTITETVFRGLAGVAGIARPLALLLVIPSLLAGIYQFVAMANIDPDASLVVYLLALVPESLIAAPFYLAMLYMISRAGQPQPTGPRDAIFAGIALFRPFVLTSLLLLVLIVGGALFLGLLLAQAKDGNALIGLIALLVVLATYLALLGVSFYPLFILYRQLSGLAALQASLALFKAYWWRVLGVLFFPAMLVLLLQNLWLQLLAATDLTQPDSRPGLPLTLLGQIYSWTLLAAFEGVRVTLFQDLQARAQDDG